MASPIAKVTADERDIHTLYIWAIASIAALGGLLFGYDWVVIGGAKPFYEAHFSSFRMVPISAIWADRYFNDH